MLSVTVVTLPRTASTVLRSPSTRLVRGKLKELPTTALKMAEMAGAPVGDPADEPSVAVDKPDDPGVEKLGVETVNPFEVKPDRVRKAEAEDVPKFAETVDKEALAEEPAKIVDASDEVGKEKLGAEIVDAKELKPDELGGSEAKIVLKPAEPVDTGKVETPVEGPEPAIEVPEEAGRLDGNVADAVKLIPDAGLEKP